MGCSGRGEGTNEKIGLLPLISDGDCFAAENGNYFYKMMRTSCIFSKVCYNGSSWEREPLCRVYNFCGACLPSGPEAPVPGLKMESEGRLWTNQM